MTNRKRVAIPMTRSKAKAAKPKAAASAPARDRAAVPAKRTKAPAPAPAVPYQRTDKEQAGVEAMKALRNERVGWTPFRIEVSAEGTAKVSSAHADELTGQTLQGLALGVTTGQEVGFLMKAAINQTLKDNDAGGAIDVENANEFLAVVAGLRPTSTVEAMLAVQMVAIHNATMRSAERMRSAGTVDLRVQYAKAMNNLSSTFGRHAETLKKLQGGGEQKVVVEHRHYHLAAGAIAPGSNAIFGDVEHSADGGPLKIGGATS